MNRAEAYLVCGLAFGDEGKGTIVDALARKLGGADVVRFNGGPQCGHNVVTADGRWHCFSQFGAATLAGDGRTILGPQMLIELEMLDVERQVLEGKGVTDPFDRLVIDPRCRLITPTQKFVGRMRELARGGKRYGSCGQGVGETINDDDLSLRVRDLLSGGKSRDILHALAERKLVEAADIVRSCDGSVAPAVEATIRQMLKRMDAFVLHDTFRAVLDRAAESVQLAESPIFYARHGKRPVIFEGAQGALLDRTRGFRPHVTQSDTSATHARSLAGNMRTRTIGVFRAYGHRHGAGPFLTEDEALRARFDDALNRENAWQGPFRVGHLDLPALRYGIRVVDGVDALAVTGLDRLSGMDMIRVCDTYCDAKGRVLYTFDGRQTSDPAWIRGCRPERWLEFPGWREDLGRVGRYEDLPKNARAFVEFLESFEGLGNPIEIVSVGPTAEQKLYPYGETAP